MIINFWGVRGSVPSPGKETNYYGGNTTCITVENEKTFIIIDGGTGIRNVSYYLEKKNIKKINVIFTHYHWDHLQGLPFFSPIFNPKIEIDIYGKRNVSNVLSMQMKRPFFPADYKNLPSQINHRKIKRKFHIDDILIETIENNHPSGCVGLKFTDNGSSMVFMTDNELNPQSNLITTTDQFVSFIKDSKLFIHDSQYTDKEILLKRGWGHSTFNEVIAVAKKAKLKSIIFTHHDPMRRDNEMKGILLECRKKNPSLKLDAAREGLELKI